MSSEMPSIEIENAGAGTIGQPTEAMKIWRAGPTSTRSSVAQPLLFLSFVSFVHVLVGKMSGRKLFFERLSVHLSEIILAGFRHSVTS